ncbi:MAG: capsular polysaccharide synthesis protein, partial [Treponema sp.]|nr:capsular polysaccharide synthesis protein [Treponema sp.]
MPNIILKTKQLLKEKKQKEFLDKTAAYIRYIFLSVWYRLTLKETDPDLKKVNKNWIVYTFLKSRYSSFLKKYETKINSVHEYSDTVWWCWFQGEENAPDVAKACLESVRKNMSGKQVIVITEKNMYDYVSMPDFIIEKYKKGIISKTHFSDLLRLELLIRHGGL